MSTAHQETIADRVRKILAEQFCRDDIDLSANIFDAYDCDSLDVVELTMAIEDDFGFEVPDEEMYKFEVGQGIADYVTANIKA
ncbi:MAG TPA: acyl carrier protein [Paraburkholderia sp.]